MAGGCALQANPRVVSHRLLAVPRKLPGEAGSPRQDHYLLRWRSRKRVDETNRHSVLVIYRRKRRSRNFAGSIRKDILVRHVAAVLEPADDVACQGAFQRSGKFTQFLRRTQSGGKAVVVYEVFSPSGEGPLCVGCILDVSGN